MNIRQFLRTYFTFNRRERNGILVLLLLVFILFTAQVVREQLDSVPVYDFSEFNRLAATLHEREVKTTYPRKDSFEKRSGLPLPAQAAGERSIYKKQELFYFNPNGLPLEDWVRLGLSKAQAQSIKNYEAKGGHFEKKEDLQRMFVISADFYRRVEAYIVIPKKAESTGPPIFSEALPDKKKTTVIIELNAADSADLQSLPGIGVVFARRIIVYRNKLGGYSSPQQLLEVFGFDAERFEQVRSRVTADAAYLSKININTADLAELKKHPYITPSVAGAIISYRKTHGAFKSLESLQDVDLVNAELYRKIAPYLTL